MNRRAPSGRTLLDLAKNSVEAFVKKRSHEPTSRGDRYMLLTTDTPYNIQIEWKESSVSSLQEFYTKLRNIKISGSTNVEKSLTKAFDLLNLHRAHSQVDNYGKGRIPWFVEVFSMIVFITDGGVSGKNQEMTFADSELKSWEITNQAHRWDQRMFGMVLQPTINAENLLLLDSGPISKACELTGGKSYLIKNERVIQTSIDTIVQKIQPGVVCNFKLIKPIKSFNLPDNYDELIKNIPCSTRKMLILKTKTAQNGMPSSSPLPGHWPIPENFLPQPNKHQQKIPNRLANPTLCFVPVPKPAKYIQAFAFDKYELEHSMLTTGILNLYKQGQEQYLIDQMAETGKPGEKADNFENNPNKNPLLSSSTAWYVYVLGSNGKNYDENYHFDYNNPNNPAENIPAQLDPKLLPPPFGYLKPNQALTAVNLYVMPYNFVKLLPLIEELTNNMRLNQQSTRQWQASFNEYLLSCPVYYTSHMKKAFKAMNAQIPSILNQEFPLLSTASIDQLKANREQANRENGSSNFEWKRKPMHVSGVGPPCVLRTSVPLKSIIPDDEFLSTNFPNFRIESHLMKKEVQHPYTNPYHIERSQLLSQLKRMKKNVQAIINLPNLIETAEHSHIRTTQQISKMGIFEDRIKNMPKPLRDVGIGQKSVRAKQSGFGNPYKKKSSGGEDSFDLDDNLDNGSIDLMNADRPTCRRRRVMQKFDVKQWNQKKLKWKTEGTGLVGYVPDLERRDEIEDEMLNREVENATNNQTPVTSSGDSIVPVLRTNSPLDDKNFGISNKTTVTSSSNNSRPVSQARATPVEIAKAHVACRKIENLLKQPGDVKRLKAAIKSEISQFDDTTNGINVDLLVLKIELTSKAIDMCEKFKRRMLQHYLVYLLRSFKEDLKRITVQNSSGAATPNSSGQQFKNKSNDNERGKPNSKNMFRPIQSRPNTSQITQHSKNDNTNSEFNPNIQNDGFSLQQLPISSDPNKAAFSLPPTAKSAFNKLAFAREIHDSTTSAPLHKRQKLDSVGNTPNTSPTYQMSNTTNPETPIITNPTMNLSLKETMNDEMNGADLNSSDNGSSTDNLSKTGSASVLASLNGWRNNNLIEVPRNGVNHTNGESS